MRREEWRDALATLIERHSAKACAGAGIAPGDIGNALGEYAASNLFGAAFENSSQPRAAACQSLKSVLRMLRAVTNLQL